jgi:hypothetical protein
MASFDFEKEIYTTSLEEESSRLCKYCDILAFFDGFHGWLVDRIYRPCMICIREFLSLWIVCSHYSSMQGSLL